MRKYACAEFGIVGVAGIQVEANTQQSAYAMRGNAPQRVEVERGLAFFGTHAVECAAEIGAVSASVPSRSKNTASQALARSVKRAPREPEN